MPLTVDERQSLTQFLSQLTAAPAPNKEPDADTLIREAVAKQPDAAYLLVQRALLMEQALNAAKAQIAQLQNQVQSTANAGRGSFLGSNPWAAPAATAGSVPGAGNYQVPQPSSSFLNQPSSGSSFLGNVATTAAGVVAGSFLFQGIESLLGHHSSGWGGSGFGGTQPQAFTEETVINNYYDSPQDQGRVADSDDDVLAQDDSGYDVGSGDDNSWV